MLARPPLPGAYLDSQAFFVDVGAHLHMDCYLSCGEMEFQLMEQSLLSADPQSARLPSIDDEPCVRCQTP